MPETERGTLTFTVKIPYTCIDKVRDHGKICCIALCTRLASCMVGLAVSRTCTPGTPMRKKHLAHENRELCFPRNWKPSCEVRARENGICLMPFWHADALGGGRKQPAAQRVVRTY